MGSEKKKRIKIRRAKPGDLGLFKKLWKEYLSDEKLLSVGGVPPTDHNMEVFEHIFNAYVSGEFEGVVLFHAEDAVLMWGDPGGQIFESNYGRQAQGWGTYVKESARKKGISMALQRKAVNILKNMKFDTVVGQVDLENEEAFSSISKLGFVKVGYVPIFYDLRSNN